MIMQYNNYTQFLCISLHNDEVYVTTFQGRYVYVYIYTVPSMVASGGTRGWKTGIYPRA
jgi:hypothetical protein